MTRPEALHRLATAIERACEEHGRPNSFGVMELCAEYGAPGSDWCYRLGRECMDTNSPHFAKLYLALGGRAKFGSGPTYNSGRFHV